MPLSGGASNPLPSEGWTGLLAWAAALMTLAVIVAGSWVHSFRGGLAVPDWPLTYGRWLPWAWQGNASWVSLHRLAAASSGVLILLLAGRLASCRSRPWLRRLGFALLVADLLQIGLGGVMVWHFLPPLLLVLHVLLSQLIFSGTVLVAVASSTRWRSPADAGLGRRARLVLAMVLLQILLGAVVRHPPADSVYLIALGLHVMGAFAVLGGINFLLGGVSSSGRRGPLVWSVYGLLSAAILQLMLGMAAMLKAPLPSSETWPPPVGFPLIHAVHQSLSALLLAIALTVVVVLSAGCSNGSWQPVLAPRAQCKVPPAPSP